MFDKKVQNTQLAGALADCMFRRINGCGYNEDFSFLSTMRALLMHRITGENKINFRVHSVAMSSNPQDMCALLSAIIQPNSIVYASVDKMNATDKENQDAFFGFSSPDGLHELTDVRTFFAEKMACRAWIDEEARCSIVMVLDSTLRKHHLVQCILPKLLPWFFANGRISVRERNLLYSLRESTPTAYMEALNAFTDTEEFRQNATAMSLVMVKRKGLEKQKELAQTEIDRKNVEIEDLNNRIIRNLQYVRQQNHKLNGILLALDSEDTDTQDLSAFILDNPYVSLVDTRDTIISLMITGYLDVYDPESYRTLASNPNSWYWSESASMRGPFTQRLNRKLVLDAIFGDAPLFKIKTFAVYSLDVQDNYAETRKTNAYKGRMADRYPNPHIAYANCLGSYRTLINAAISKGDLTSAITHCISSVHSVNVTESATFGHLCKDIFETDAPILEGPNGKSFTTLQAYEYLTAQQQSEGE